MAGFEDLKVYQLAYRLAMMVFHESKAFPKKEVGRILGAMMANPSKFNQ